MAVLVNHAALDELARRVAHDLECLDYHAAAQWTLRKPAGAEDSVDVLVVGAGQSGLATALALHHQGIHDFRVIDKSPKGLEGPWRTYARMHDLRTAKRFTGPDLGIPSLTPRAWYEARYGVDAWNAIGTISRPDWGNYLEWFRETLKLEVDNECELENVSEKNGRLLATYRSPEGVKTVLARKIVLATGFAGSGDVTIPGVIKNNLPVNKYAHSSSYIDFESLRGKRVAVIGAGAAAFECSATALEHGAATVDLIVRRASVPRVNAFYWTEFAGVSANFAELPDIHRWRFSRRLLEAGHPPPVGSLQRCEPFGNFHIRTGEQWFEIKDTGRDQGFRVRSERGWREFDFVICGTGNTPDIRKFPPMARYASNIASWGDRLEVPPEEASAKLAGYPYLGPSFELTELNPGRTPQLKNIHCLNYSAQVSMGNSAGAPAIKYSVPRLVRGIVCDLFVDDADEFYQQFLDFKVPEPSYVAFLDGVK